MKLINTVTAIVKDEHGNIVDKREEKNTITTGDPSSVENGLVYLLDRMFGNGDYFDPDDTIAKMQLGTGTPDNSGLGTPITSPDDTMIVFDSVEFDPSGSPWYTSPKIQATCIWDSDFGALSGITEAGLFTDPLEYMFAYKAFSPALSKTALGSITIIWEVQISAT